MTKRIRRYEDQELDDDECPYKEGPEESRVYRDLHFTNCAIIGASIATFGGPKNRSSITNVGITNCRVNSFGGYGAVFDGVEIDGLKVSVHPVSLAGCVFRHVVLKGVCGRFLLSPKIDYDDDKRSAVFDADNMRFYESVDWALDISKMQAACFEINGSIPSRLIRRNPDEQFIMTRAVAVGGDWQKHLPPPTCAYGIESFLQSGASDNVFVAARQARHFKEEAEYFHRLKCAGLVR